MTPRSYCQLAASLFAIIAVLQFIRAIGGFEIMVNGTISVPVWASWIACVVIKGLRGSVSTHHDELDYNTPSRAKAGANDPFHFCH